MRTHTSRDDGANAKRLPIASLIKSLRVLEELGLAGGSASVADLIARTGLERTTVQRVLRTLHVAGYVDRTARGEYSVAPRAYVLGAMLSKGSHFAVAADPVLRRLQQRTGEAVHAAVLDGTDVLCVAHVPANKMLSFTFPVGARLPAYASSLGRCILACMPPGDARELLQLSDRRGRTPTTLTSLKDLSAELERVREQGYSVVTSEVERGVSAVAAPILGPTGEVLAAINVVVPMSRIEQAELHGTLVPPLLEASQALSQRLGGTQAAPSAARA
jgi:IclR family pca regulon transcriptional regulator